MRRTTVCRWLGVLLVALFLSHYAGVTLFVHTHDTVDGRTVTHSHPYAPSSAHGHTMAGFAAIDALSHWWFCVAAVGGVSVFLAFVLVRRVEKSRSTRAVRLEWRPLRGPPVVC